MNRDLDDRMSMDHVVRVHPDGTVTDVPEVYAPEVSCDYTGPFADSQISDDDEQAMIENLAAQGWTVQTGWTGQDRYGGAIMHPSEFIGGSLADHVLETPGYWVACSVELHPGEDDPEYRDGSGESESAGWVLLHREAPEGS